VLGYDVKPLCERCPTFRLNAVHSPMKVKNSVVSLKNLVIRSICEAL